MLALRAPRLAPRRAQHSSQPVVSGTAGIIEDLGAVCAGSSPVLLPERTCSATAEWAKYIWVLSCCNVDFMSVFSSVVAEKWPMRITEALRRKRLS